MGGQLPAPYGAGHNAGAAVATPTYVLPATFPRCRRELSEEWRMKGEEFMGSSSQFFHVIRIVDICFYRKSTNTIGIFKLILALCEQVEQA